MTTEIVHKRLSSFKRQTRYMLHSRSDFGDTTYFRINAIWLANLPIRLIFPVGNHGYDNALAEMRPIFLAHGPAFRKNFTKEAMNSTDLYPLLCHLLNITGMPHNGSLRGVQDLLSSTTPRVFPYTQRPTLLHGRVKPREDEREASYAYFLGVSLGSILVLVFFVIFIKHLIRSQIPASPDLQAEIAQPLLQA